MNRRPFLFALVVTLLAAAPAAATGGGDELPFNAGMTTIANNLSGPTATTICVVLFIAGLLTVGVTRESGGAIKTIGWVVAICACIAKAPQLMSTLGLTGTTALFEASTWSWMAACSIGYSVLLPTAILWTLRSEGERRSPSRTH